MKKVTLNGSLDVKGQLYLTDADKTLDSNQYIQYRLRTNTTPKLVNGTKGYLYDITYFDYDYKYAQEWDFNTSNTITGGGCSSARFKQTRYEGERPQNFVGRNFDWYYNNDIEFLVKSEKPGKHRSVGVAHCKVDKDQFKTDDTLFEKWRKIIPFYLLDGINDAGLVVNSNVVPHIPEKWGENKEVYGYYATEDSEKIPALFLVRFLLDNCSSIVEVEEYLRNKIIVQPDILLNAGLDLHYMVNDETSCIIIELIDNQLSIYHCNIDATRAVDGYPIMTNFHESSGESSVGRITAGPLTTSYGGVEFYRLSVPGDSTDIETHSATIENKIEEYGQGLERWNKLQEVRAMLYNTDIYDGPSDEMEILKGMSNVFYDKVYTEEEFRTDFASPEEELTVDSTPEEYQSMKSRALAAWNRRNRSNPIVWQTTHCCVYNINERTVWIKVQNGDFDTNGTYPWSYETPLVVVRSLNDIQETYVLAGLQDETGTNWGHVDAVDHASYRIVGDRELALNINKFQTCEVHFEIGDNTITLPSSWYWIDQDDGQLSTDIFEQGTTYSVAVRHDGKRVLANVSYSHPTPTYL